MNIIEFRIVANPISSIDYTGRNLDTELLKQTKPHSVVTEVWDFFVSPVITVQGGKLCNTTSCWRSLFAPHQAYGSRCEREWTAGRNTPFIIMDDVYEITRNTTGVNRLQKRFSVTIQTPLVVKMNCRFFALGSVLIQIEGHPGAILDYGDGTCDNIATITVNGEAKTIRLGKR